MTDISFVIPVYNEADSIVPLLAEIRAALADGPRYEVICVDDGSTDETLRRLTALRSPCLRIVRHRYRCGQSAAIWSGAKAARFPWIVTLDGDGQNDPRDVSRLLAVLEDPCRPARLEMIAGIRKQRRDSWLKRVSSRIANRVRQKLLKDGVADTGCGLKLIERRALLRLPRFDHMHRFLPALILRGGGTIVTVGVSHRPRLRGASKYGVRNRLWVGIVDLLGVRWLQRRMTLPEVEEVESGVPLER